MDFEVDCSPARDRHHADVGVSDERRGEQRPAEIVHLRPLERVAGLEPRDQADVARAERRATAHSDRAEAGDRAGVHRQAQRREVGLVIDFDVLFAELRFGIALLTERRGEREAGGDYICRDHRVAGLDGKRVPKPRRIGSGGVKAGKIDRREAILGAGVDGEDDAEANAGLLGARLDGSVIIALRPE